eukprot:gene14026-15493_t
MLLLYLLFFLASCNARGASFPVNEYNYLKELYDSTNGSNWFDNTNWNFENISLYNPCLQRWYGVFADCGKSTEGNSAEGTTGLYLDANNLIGRLPSILTNFTVLIDFWVSDNHLTGPFPSFIDCPLLSSIHIFNNYLTGPLMENMLHNLPKISSLFVWRNYLNGSFPDVIYQLYQLQNLDLSENMFSGTVSEHLENLTNLEELFLSSNQFYGKFPSNVLINMTQLEQVALDFNQFSGSILFILSYLPKLVEFSVSNNHFDGSFPAHSVELEELNSLLIGENSFTGRLPFWLCELPQIVQFNISYNKLTGSVPMCFDNFTDLVELSLGHNFLTGPIPIQTFFIPDLLSLSMPDNCFDGTIDDSICENIAQSLIVVNLNDLHSTKCDSTGLFASKQKLKGATVPRCLWELPSLSGLFLSANALYGSIPPDIQMADTITTLSISHNYFSGSIPTFIQEHAFTYLDLSYNKFRGTVKEVTSSSFSDVSRGEGYWNITHNRISGSLSSVFENVEGVNMLEGNLFACSGKGKGSYLPKDDPGYSNYFCGSSQLDYASYLLAGTNGLLLVFCMIVMIVRCRECLGDFLKQPRAVYERLETLYKEHLSLLSIFPVGIGREDRFDKLYRLCVTLEVFMRVCVRMLILIFVLLLPTYLIFYHGDEANYKYDFEYSWVQTSAYLTGRIAGAVLFVFWVLVIVVFLVLVMMSHDLSRQETLLEVLKGRMCWFSNSSETGKKQQDLHLSLLRQDDVLKSMEESGRREWKKPMQNPEPIAGNQLILEMRRRKAIEYCLSYLLFLTINVVATFTLNYFYLSILSASSTTFEFKVGVQIGLAMIKLFWNYCV